MVKLIRKREDKVTDLSSHTVAIVSAIALALYDGAVIGVVAPQPHETVINRILICFLYGLKLVFTLVALCYLLIHPKKKEKKTRQLVAVVSLLRYFEFITYPLIEPTKSAAIIANMGIRIRPFIYALRPTAVEFMIEVGISFLILIPTTSEYIFTPKTGFSPLSLGMGLMIPVVIFLSTVIDQTEYDTSSIITPACMSTILIVSMVSLLVINSYNVAVINVDHNRSKVSKIILWGTGVGNIIGNSVFISMIDPPPQSTSANH